MGGAERAARVLHLQNPVRSYLKKYDEALQLEREGKAVLVYFDEVSVAVAHRQLSIYAIISMHHSISSVHLLLAARIPRGVAQSYIHQNHSPSESWINENTSEVERESGKGRRLIILHAITKYGPLGERSEISWRHNRRNTDTPHEVKKVADGPDDRSAELLWVSSSSTGDYHNNMNSEMFMKCKLSC